jgi:hypothetical protein
VTQHLHQDPRRHALSQQQGRRRVAQVVKPYAGHQADAVVTVVDLIAPDPGPDEQGFERPLRPD